ncbi:glycosyltransferase [Vibrio cholerae]|uniref:glycosyltransferase n=1 Tax=Vibrio cholerae TaxID=666 RepID=UPI000E0C00F7|nr:glycosyltransferase [Vibrio cholerae]MCD6657578.1 glycosyltransferase [Vibrio cholerae]TQP24664.1 glycosyltransferase [Vibrio cholerae]GHY15075.1 glycosyl transferase [Vibrio cholerae]GIA33617.1 glycosyl transferase [Vibrio cholerae]
MMTVAVLICVYGGDNLLHFKECIDSIKSESLSGELNINIYLHVDGPISHDMNDYIKSQEFFIVIRSEIGVGLAAGLNKLIQNLGEEEFVFRMDADDIVVPGRFNSQLNYMQNHPNVDISGGSIAEFLRGIDNIVNVRSYPLVDEDIKSTLFRASPLAHMTVCFRKGYFDRFGLYPTSYPFNEDLAYWIQSSQQNVVFGNINNVLVNVRMDGAYDRRRTLKAWPEFKLYSYHNIRHFKLPIIPFMRYIFRYFPKHLVKVIYNSSIRKLFT